MVGVGGERERSGGGFAAFRERHTGRGGSILQPKLLANTSHLVRKSARRGILRRGKEGRGLLAAAAHRTRGLLLRFELK